MPTRLLREGILSSDRVDQLDYAAEVFYRRLMSKVDDHGLYDARPTILRANLYPLRIDRVREADISRWIAICVKAGLIALYQHGGKPYLQMIDTRWQARSEAKYPKPNGNDSQPLTNANNGKQAKTDAPVVVVVDVSVDVVGKSAASPPPGVEAENWRAWVRQKGKKQTAEADRLQRKHLEQWRAEGHDVNRIVENAVAGHWAGLHPPDKGKASSLRERGVANMDRLTGQGKGNGLRTINGTAERVDRPSLPSLPNDLRESLGDDVDRDRSR